MRGTSSDRLGRRPDNDLHTHACLLCFLTRQPDKLVVVWTRRSRRKSSKVCTEEKACPRLCRRCSCFPPLSPSPTAGSLASKTPTEEWWCGLCPRTSRSPSPSLRYEHRAVGVCTDSVCQCLADLNMRSLGPG